MPDQPNKKRASERFSIDLHIKRITAIIQTISSTNDKSKEKNMLIQVILNDFSLNGIGFFSQKQLNPDQEIYFKMDEPFDVKILSKVVWCKHYNSNSHVISKETFIYRVGIKFIFENAEEQNKVKILIDKLKQDHIYLLKS